MIKKLLLLSLLPGCSLITDSDKKFTKEFLNEGTGCVYVQGSGGGGALALGLPAGGGYGQGSLSAARSNQEDAKVSCSEEGAKVE